ncbi:MAG TPA: hypothetical protein VHB19_10095 [Devosia sp.]|jgi:hypothetical protein|nr:hypothetical protein [Devosia sp.]
MTSKAALLTLLTLWGVGAAVPHQAWADETAAEQSSDSKDEPASDLTNRVWVKAGDDAALPGVIKVFLSDGTLVQDSCWETHRLSPWQMTDARSLTWNEDGMDIKADIVTLTADELVLSLKLKGGDVEEHYTPAPVPSVCPDVPKG